MGSVLSNTMQGGEIPAFAGMTWEAAGMTWEAAGMTGVSAGMMEGGSPMRGQSMSTRQEGLRVGSGCGRSGVGGRLCVYSSLGG